MRRPSTQLVQLGRSCQHEAGGLLPGQRGRLRVTLIFFDQRELPEGAVVGLLALDLAAGSGPRFLVRTIGRGGILAAGTL
jgi:hypothetical protein